MNMDTSSSAIVESAHGPSLGCPDFRRGFGSGCPYSSEGGLRTVPRLLLWVGVLLVCAHGLDAQAQTTRVPVPRMVGPATNRARASFVPPTKIFSEHSGSAWLVHGWVRVELDAARPTQDLIVLSLNTNLGPHALLARGESALGLQFKEAPSAEEEPRFSCTFHGTNIQARWATTNVPSLDQGGASLVRVGISDALEIYARLSDTILITPAYPWKGDLSFSSRDRQRQVLADQLKGVLRQRGVVFIPKGPRQVYAVPAALTNFVEFLETKPALSEQSIVEPGNVKTMLARLSSVFAEDWTWSFGKLTSRRLQGAIPARITAPDSRGFSFVDRKPPPWSASAGVDRENVQTQLPAKVELAAGSWLEALTAHQAVDWLGKRALLSGTEFKPQGEQGFSLVRSPEIFEHWAAWARAYSSNSVTQILNVGSELAEVYGTLGRRHDRLRITLDMLRLDESRGTNTTAPLSGRILASAEAHLATGDSEEADLLVSEYLEPERLKDPRLDKFPETVGYWYGQKRLWKQALEAYRLVLKNERFPLGHIYRPGQFTASLMLVLNRHDLYGDYRKEMLAALVETAVNKPNSDSMKEYFSTSYSQALALVSLILATPVPKAELEALRKVTEVMIWERADQTNAFTFKYPAFDRTVIPTLPGPVGTNSSVPRKRRVWTKPGPQDVKGGIARGQLHYREGSFQRAMVDLRQAAEDLNDLPEGWIPLRVQVYSLLAMTLHRSGNAEEADTWWRKAQERGSSVLDTVGTPSCQVWSDALLGSILYQEADATLKGK